MSVLLDQLIVRLDDNLVTRRPRTLEDPHLESHKTSK
jgi:hypothetical protein